jgi:hypothetical protein
MLKFTGVALIANSHKNNPKLNMSALNEYGDPSITSGAICK